MNPQQEDPNARKKGIIFAVVASVVVIILIVLVNWLASHSFIEITIPNASGNTNVVLTNQSKGGTSEFQTSESKVKKLVNRGTYEVYVSQDGKNALAYVNAGGFLTTKSVTANPQAERGRAFIGDNPATCMMLTGILASYECNGLLQNVGMHMPATATQPTYIQKDPTHIDGGIEGTAVTSEGTILLARPSHTDTDQGPPPHSAYNVGDNFTLNDRTVLNDLKTTVLYSIKPLGKGFVVYDAGYTNAYYYSSLKAKPRKLTVAEASSTALKPYAFVTEGDKYGVVYTSSGGVNELVLQSINNDDVQRHRLPATYNSAMLCGGEGKLLCGLVEKSLSVIDLENSGKESLRWDGVSSINKDGANLIAVQDKRLLRVNLQDDTGSVDYTFGQFAPCGFTVTKTGYVVCVQDGLARRYALNIDRQKVSDGIDQKVASLLKLEDVKLVSAYGTYIFIVPKAGSLEWQPSLGRFDYDPAKLAAANKSVDDAVKAAGIDQSVYTIVNPLAKHTNN